MLIVYFFLTILFTLQVQSTGSPDFSKLNDLMQ